MAGLYIHIPFCRSRCIYCAFYSTTSLDLRQRYVDAVCREMVSRGGTAIDTVYLGGGTPSQLTIAQLEQLFLYINKVYSLSPHAEVTIEANPDDVTESFAATVSQLGINRVSMGAQTFDDCRLRFLRRRHTSAQVAEAVGLLRRAGIRNISIDLMYGFPGETLDEWQHDIACALDLGVEHISAYCLTIEDDTPLQRMNVSPADEETERQMYYALIDRLTQAGYEHYEISNFALKKASPAGDGLKKKPPLRGEVWRDGVEKKPPLRGEVWRGLHNSGYWTDQPYIGLGAAAHSYDRQRRQWNVSDINAYIKGIESGTPDFGFEILDDATHYNDRVMLALRTCDGLDLGTLTDADRQYLLPLAHKHIGAGLLRLDGSRLILTRKGLFVSDLVISDLMLV